MNKILICTDLDRTLIPNGKQPESPGAMACFHRLAACNEVKLAYVSGRHRTLIKEAIAEFDLPRPDFVIANVGTTLYEIQGNRWEESNAWDVVIAPDWHDLTPAELNRKLAGFPELRLQEAEKQSHHKLSFYVSPKVNSGQLLADIKAQLEIDGIKANLIWSIDEMTGLGLLDILPAGANKLHALEFLMQDQGYTLQNTVFSGDSGNDLEIFVSPVKSTVVANADPELKQTTALQSPPGSFYLARGGYLGMNGNYSAGILEGLAHYLPEVDAWLQQQCGD